jgi:hypothetical protein
LTVLDATSSKNKRLRLLRFARNDRNTKYFAVTEDIDQTAQHLKQSRDEIKALTQGKIGQFSVDTLIIMLNQVGMTVKVEICPLGSLGRSPTMESTLIFSNTMQIVLPPEVEARSAASTHQRQIQQCDRVTLPQKHDSTISPQPPILQKSFAI